MAGSRGRRRIARVLPEPLRSAARRWAGQQLEGGDRRAFWERAWQQQRAFGWRLDAAPEQLIDHLGRRPRGGTALDIGCGAGEAAVAMARSFDRVLAVDFARAAVEEARRRARGPAQPSFGVADAARLPVRSAVVDLAFDRGCLHALPEEDRRCYLDELVRVIKPGATALLIEIEAKLPGGIDGFASGLPDALELEEQSSFTLDRAGREWAFCSLVLRRS